MLLDTHLALWWQTGDRRLSEEARKVIGSNGDPVLVSQVSLWELAIKSGLGRLRIDLPVFASQVEAMGFGWLAMGNSHILRLAELPVFADHRDPFDRLLVAQATSETLLLLTVDAKLRRYGDLVRVV